VTDTAETVEAVPVVEACRTSLTVGTVVRVEVIWNLTKTRP